MNKKTKIMHVFYKPGFHNKLIYLDSSESYHCSKVLRLQEGQNVLVINGKGFLYNSSILKINSIQTVLEVNSVMEKYGKRNYYLHVAIAPTKNIERFEWFIEKATEIGIDEITPLICKRSERKKLRYDRLEKILLSAVKQSCTAYMPHINEAVSFNDLIISQSPQIRFIAYCSNINEHLLVASKDKTNIMTLIGPEGDFTPDEISLATDHGCIPVNLGNKRLRTETAGIVVAQIVADSQIINR